MYRRSSDRQSLRRSTIRGKDVELSDIADHQSTVSATETADASADEKDAKKLPL